MVSNENRRVSLRLNQRRTPVSMLRASLVAVALFLCCVLSPLAALAQDGVTMWFPPEWSAKTADAMKITQALSASGVAVSPRVAKSYPEILEAFASGKPALVFVGSFVQAVLVDRGLAIPLAQGVNGKEMYAGVMLFPKGQDAKAILEASPAEIAYAKGASSGESAAKAATQGKAAKSMPNHNAAAGAVKVGEAKGAFVKNWWWMDNKDKFPELDMAEIPGASEAKNPDNLVSASKSVPADALAKLTPAILGGAEAFGVKEMRAFDPANVQFSIELMKKGGLDPKTYAW